MSDHRESTVFSFINMYKEILLLKETLNSLKMEHETLPVQPAVKSDKISEIIILERENELLVDQKKNFKELNIALNELNSSLKDNVT